MKIYVDYDDCLCETARHFSWLIKDLFGMDIPYEKIMFFDLKKSFSLTEDQYEEMMIKAHRPESLLSYEETPGASETINSWIDKGYDVSVITGRPASSYEPSRKWLDCHGMDRVRLFCLNKYGRDKFYTEKDFSLQLEDYYKMHFDYAVEDSPSAFRFFEHLPDMKVMVYDRPWNRDCSFPGENYSRCSDWQMIRNMVK